MVLTMVGVSTMAEDAVVSRCRSLPASIDSRYDPRQVLKFCGAASQSDEYERGYPI